MQQIDSSYSYIWSHLFAFVHSFPSYSIRIGSDVSLKMQGDSCSILQLFVKGYAIVGGIGGKIDDDDYGWLCHEIDN